MRVLKRNGHYQNVSFDKVTARIANLCKMEPILTDIDPEMVAQKVCSQIFDGIHTSKLDELAAETCTQLSVKQLSYGILASRLIISNNHKLTLPLFSQTLETVAKHNPKLVDNKILEFVLQNAGEIDRYLDYNRDYMFDYFGFKTLERAYLLKASGKVVERIQHMFMRVSLGLHCGNLERCFETYDLMSQKYFIHATPTLFHSGTQHPQLLSCFLMGIEDSIAGIYKAIADCAQISKWAGGIGVHIHDVRGDNALIRSTNGRSTGIMPMLKVFNDVARHVNQCFTPDTWVYGEKGPIQMKDCNIGDNLYTIDGSLKPILQISINEVDKEILSITNDIVRKPIRVTKEHQIYARLKDCKPEYINATDLNKNYYVSYPKYNEQIHKSNSELLNLNKKIEETNDYYIDDYLYWVPIRSIDVIHYKGDVYDFNMMDNHNYLTDMGIVHNSGKRNGSFAMYLEPHHIDIMSFLEAKKNHGDENSRARDLFYAVWLSDLFMERVKNKQMWSLMDPDTCKGLSEVYGNEYKKLYEEYEKDPTKVIKQVPALDVWKEIIKSQMETGTPYICYKDAGNEKSNQKNYGTIKSSNLCTEIYEYSDHKEYACCTLASIALPTYVEEFDYSTINSIDVYTKSDCKFCNYSKGFLKTRGLTYTEHNLDDEIVRGDFFKELNKKSGGIECDGDNCRIVLKNKRFTSVPQIFINGEHIGGFAELYAYFKPTFNYKKLYDVTKVITRNLNKVIDLNFYPVPETRISNFRHRPIGIGVQGLADVYAKYRVSFDSQLASELNKEIFATIYYASCEASYELAQEFATHIQNNMSLSPENRDPMILPEDIEMYNNNDRYLGSYHTFKGSPISQGQFQFDLWKASPLKSVGCVYNDDGSIKSVLNGGVVFNWEELRHKIMEQGMRNSLLLAPMPTASTSQILGNNECIEPFTSNIYSRGTLAGQFVVLNKYLMNDLQSIGVWSNDLMDTIILNNGSINGINAIPEVIRNTYKVVWDLSMKALIDQAADRGIYICQSQSLNLWLEDPDLSKLTSMHFYAWQKGLKTGIYYLRRRAVSKAQTFSIDATKTTVNKNDSSKESDCLMCSS
jgi:ribonucleotide reductase alpha subunit